MSTRPITVAIFVDDLEATGVVINAIAVAGRLATEGFDCRIVAARAAGTLLESVPPEVPVVGLLPADERGSRKARLRRAIFALRRHLRAAPPDVLFSAGNQGHLASAVANWGLPARLVVRVSNDLEHRAGGTRPPALSRWWRTAKFRLIASRAAALVFVSRHLLRGASAAGMSLGDKAVVIPNGVNIARVRDRAEQACTHPWLSGAQEEPVVLAIGRLVQQKNFETLLDAVAIAGKLRRLRLLVIGSGPLQASLLDQARSLGIAADVEIIPPVPNPVPFMARASVLALPSWWEGSSNVLLEAIACGTAVVTSRTAGSAEEVLDRGRFGLLVDADDPGAMAEALLAQSGNSPRLPADRAEAYSRDSTLDAYVALFRRLAGER